MDFMEQALSLATLALGQVSPNPAVGAVIVKNGVVVGQGYTQPPGSHHAEIVALQQAGEKAKDAVLYVTLEPCCHFGRTPPCTRAIIKAGVSEVHAAMIDPNPIVCGKGKAELEQAGIKVYFGENEKTATEINEAYIKYITTGIPFVTAKFAVSLDGKIATRTGDSFWITGETARNEVHRIRYAQDAIMVGVNTVLADNPQLTTRYHGMGGLTKKQPLRVVVDCNGRTPLNARLFSQPGKTLIAVGSGLETERKVALTQAGAELIELPSQNGMVDLRELLIALGKREIASVLVEGGGTLIGSLFDTGLVDKVTAFIAPTIIGGKEAKTPVGGQGVAKMADALRLECVMVEQFDGDIMVSGYVPRKAR